LTPVIIHPQAFLEIEGAKKWYESQSQGLKDQFMNELDHGMEYTWEYPESWPAYVSGTRRYLLHRFPFAIVYSYDGTTVKVFALMHLHRKPGYWLKRFNLEA
jgi:hypothetical protein